MAETDEFGNELIDFRKRVDELRTARTLPPQEQFAALDAALFELQYAADVLWPRYEDLASRPRSDGTSGAGAREQHLLRALFQRLPVAVVLLDSDGVVRRLNPAACQLFGMRAGYATGRSLSASFRHEGRAAFRGQVAAVARAEGDRGMVVEVMRPVRTVPEQRDASASEQGGEQTSEQTGRRAPHVAPGGLGPGALRVTLTQVRPSGQRRNMVLAVFLPASEPVEDEPVNAVLAPPADDAGGHSPDPDEVSRNAELMDLVDDMASSLLTHHSAGGDQLLRRACGLLRERFADWVIADVATTPGGSGRLRRVAVLGPQGDGPTDSVDTTRSEDIDGFETGQDSAHGANVEANGAGEPGGAGADGAQGGDGADPAGGHTGGARLAAVAGQNPADAPLIREVARSGGSALQVWPQDTRALGEGKGGASVLALTEASSLLCVPLPLPSGTVHGVLTLIRSGGRRPFELAEAGAMDRMARHIALALLHAS